MIISFFQILELWIQWIIIENTYPTPSKLCTILTKKVPEIPEEVARRRTIGTMWSRDPYHPIYTDKVEQNNQDLKPMNNIT